MSLVALTHRRLATVAASAMTINAVLDAFWTAVDPTVTTYSDGSTRSFSGASATGWTWSRVQPTAGTTEALWASPPGGSMAQRVIIAGRSAAPTPSPTMVSPDLFLASGLHISHQLSAGAFTTWNSATPFTNARFMGFTRLAAAVTTYTSVAVCVYESQESIWIELLTNGTSIWMACAGALFDPETTAAASGETDGRRYGLTTCGSNSAMLSNFLGSGTGGTLLVQGTTSGQAHGYIWRPGSTTVDTVARQFFSAGTQTAAQLTDLAGQFPGQPILVPASNAWCGRFREVYAGRPVLYHQRIDTTPGVIAAYGVGWSTTTATGDSLFLKY